MYNKIVYNNILSKYYYIMFDQYNEVSNYMTYDSSSLNQYNYKNMNDVLPVYQQNENMYHFTRQINPITLSKLNHNKATLSIRI